MSVWKDRNGRYHVAVQRGGSRVHRICPPAATWRDAKRKEAELEQRFDSVAAGKVLIADAIQHWLKTEVAHQKARKSTEGNAYALAEWIKGKSLQNVGEVANAYKAANRGLVTNSTINRRLAVLRRVANLAYRRWGWLQDPLGQKIELLPENQARERFLDRSELARLLRGIPNRAMRKAALVAAFTGLRRGELARLRPINVQGDLIYVGNTKTSRPRVVPVVHHIAFALRRLPFGVHADTLTHAVQRAMPGFRFHDLRHTAASLLIASGVDLYRVGAILGHSDIRTTKRYAHLAVNDLRTAVATLGRKSAQRLHRADVDKKTGTEAK
jgi:integrase